MLLKVILCLLFLDILYECINGHPMDWLFKTPYNQKRKWQSPVAFTTLPEENVGLNNIFLMEGDILVDLRRNAVRNRDETWLKRIVPYEIITDYREDVLENIRMAMDEIQANTCLRFTRRNSEPDYIQIIAKDGCYSPIGRKGGAQDVSIGVGCESKGTVLHELMHALGFWHEHNRPDRDSYITIIWDNIAPDHKGNFELMSDYDVDTLGSSYDYGSIMHYASNTFAINRSQNTIVPKQPLRGGEVLGQRLGLSDIDIDKIKRLYKCDIKTCGDPQSPQNGYRIGDNFNVGETVSYICNSGHINIGSQTRYCKDDGEWTGNLPVCLLDSPGGSTHYCSFDDCSWQQEKDDDLDWTQAHTGTPSDQTGPTEDHTYGNYRGYFMYLEASEPAQRGNKARIVSNLIQRTSPQMCLVFYYHMYGEGMGTLNVYLRESGRSIRKWTMSDDQGNAWHLQTVTLNPSTDFQIVFEAVRGPSYKSDMAIDDVIILPCDEADNYHKMVLGAKDPNDGTKEAKKSFPLFNKHLNSLYQEE